MNKSIVECFNINEIVVIMMIISPIFVHFSPMDVVSSGSGGEVNSG